MQQGKWHFYKDPNKVNPNTIKEIPFSPDTSGYPNELHFAKEYY